MELLAERYPQRHGGGVGGQRTWRVYLQLAGLSQAFLMVRERLRGRIAHHRLRRRAIGRGVPGGRAPRVR